MLHFSHPVVHPSPPAQGEGANGVGNGVIMRDPWTRCGLVFRLLQAVMESTHDFSVTTFRSNCAMPVECCRGHCGCPCTCCQTFLPNWPDCHHTCPRRLRHRNTDLFSAACGSVAITTLLSNDLGVCSVNPCASFMNTTAMAFLSWLARALAFIGNLWTAVHRIQRS